MPLDINKNQIIFDICPCCYNKGIDIEDIAEEMTSKEKKEIKEGTVSDQKTEKDGEDEDEEDVIGDCHRFECAECPNVSCGFSAARNKVITCPTCKKGDMLLHPST